MFISPNTRILAYAWRTEPGKDQAQILAGGTVSAGAGFSAGEAAIRLAVEAGTFVTDNLRRSLNRFDGLGQETVWHSPNISRVNEDRNKKPAIGSPDIDQLRMRTARRWIYSLFPPNSTNSVERYAFAAGLIAGLSENTRRYPKARELITYIHCLLDDDNCLSPSSLQISFDQPPPPSIRDAIREGHQKAISLIDSLTRPHGEV